MRATRRRVVLKAVGCGTRLSSRERARALPVSHILHGDINVAYTRYKANKDIMGTLVHFRKKTWAEGSNRRSASPGDVAGGMLYVDDTGVVSQLPVQLRKMIG